MSESPQRDLRAGVSSRQNHPSKHWLCLINVRLNSATPAEASVFRWPSQMWPKYHKQLLPVACFRVFQRVKGESFLSLVVKLAINFPITSNFADVRRSALILVVWFWNEEQMNWSSLQQTLRMKEPHVRQSAHLTIMHGAHLSAGNTHTRHFLGLTNLPPTPKTYSQHALFSLVWHLRLNFLSSSSTAGVSISIHPGGRWR